MTSTALAPAPRPRPLPVRAAGRLVTVLAVYLVARAIAEPFVIDLGDASTYRHDWGGPHLLGVLAVHCGPAVPSLFWLARVIRSVRTVRTAARGTHGGSR